MVYSGMDADVITTLCFPRKINNKKEVKMRNKV